MSWCCLRTPKDIKVLDYRHSGLSHFPSAVFNAGGTLEELHLDSNQIKSLPQDLFRCHGIRKLTFGNNDVTSIPPGIGNLSNLEELDISKNGVNKVPEELKGCKMLKVLDASINPIGRLPDSFTCLLNLTCLHLNDTFLEYLPGNFGRLSKLKILELRENHLKSLPNSLSRLTDLERLDIGNNEMTELPAVIGSLCSLLELWCDANFIATVPPEIGKLKQVMYIDMSKNRVTELPNEMEGCEALSDLHLSTNLLKTLPHTIGKLSNLTTLKVDDNQIISLPPSIGGLASISELDISANDLEEIPATIGFLRLLRTFIADENFLVDIPPEIGSCSGLTVLSVRSNRLTYLPDEIGRIPRLRVLNLSDNEIKCLPYSLTDLRELKALWLAENQAKPLIQLQPELDSVTGRRSLTCYLLPQQRIQLGNGYGDDGQSFHPSIWDEERAKRQQIHFDTAGSDDGKTTTYPKEMRKLVNPHMASSGKKEEDTVDKGKKSVHIGNGEEETKASPHRLLKLEKERKAKDKAKINKRFSLEGSKKAMSELVITPDKKSTPKSKLFKEDDGGFLAPSGNTKTRSYTSLQTAGNERGGGPAYNLLTSTPNAYSLSAVNRTDHRPNLFPPPIITGAVSPKLPRAAAQESTPNQSEDNFGVFVSDENPEDFRRRFQYYQRAKKNLRSRDTASDVGYYRRDQRKPLLAGTDGGYGGSDAGGGVSDAGSVASEGRRRRRRGDGYASDYEGYTGNRKHLRHLIQPSLLSSHDERAESRYGSSSVTGGQRGSQQQLLTSRSSLHNENPGLTSRPPLPPAYHNAMSGRRRPGSRSASQENFNKDPVYPPPPPYKPPVRDVNPDGASNEDVPVSPSQEYAQKYEGVSGNKDGVVTVTMAHTNDESVRINTRVNGSHWNDGNISGMPVNESQQHSNRNSYHEQTRYSSGEPYQSQPSSHLQYSSQPQHRQHNHHLYEPVSPPASSSSSSHQFPPSHQMNGAPEVMTSSPYGRLCTPQSSSQSSESGASTSQNATSYYGAGGNRLSYTNGGVVGDTNGDVPSGRGKDGRRVGGTREESLYSAQIAQRLQKMGVPGGGWGGGRNEAGSPGASSGEAGNGGVNLRPKSEGRAASNRYRNSEGRHSDNRGSETRQSGVRSHDNSRESGARNSELRISIGKYSENRLSGVDPQCLTEADSNQRSSLLPPTATTTIAAGTTFTAPYSNTKGLGPRNNPVSADKPVGTGMSTFTRLSNGPLIDNAAHLPLLSVSPDGASGDGTDSLIGSSGVGTDSFIGSGSGIPPLKLPDPPPMRPNSRYRGGDESPAVSESSSFMSVGRIPPPQSYSGCTTPPLPPLPPVGSAAGSAAGSVTYDVMTINIQKSPNLGFSITGGKNSQTISQKSSDKGIFVSKVSTETPASNFLQTGDKILQVNGKSFADLSHKAAVDFLKQVDQQICITIERMKPTTV